MNKEELDCLTTKIRKILATESEMEENENSETKNDSETQKNCFDIKSFGIDLKEVKNFKNAVMFSLKNNKQFDVPAIFVVKGPSNCGKTSFIESLFFSDDFCFTPYIRPNLNYEQFEMKPDEKGIELHKKKFLNKTVFPIFYNNKTSDCTGLQDHSIDIIFVAQAFHWFNIETTKKEFQRIIKPQGKIFILGRFLDQEDSVSAEYISLTRWGKRKNGFTNNIEAYSKEIMTSFFDYPVERRNICSEIEMHSLERLQDEIDIRIDSSGDEELKNKKNIREEIHNSIKDFYNKNCNTEGFVPLKFDSFYFCF